MSTNYDTALSLVENEVNRDCEYYVYSELRDAIDVLEDDARRLETENAKLRELVKDALTCQLRHERLERESICVGCLMDGTDACDHLTRACELGVELSWALDRLDVDERTDEET